MMKLQITKRGPKFNGELNYFRVLNNVIFIAWIFLFGIKIKNLNEPGKKPDMFPNCLIRTSKWEIF